MSRRVALGVVAVVLLAGGLALARRPDRPLPATARADFVRIDTSEHTLVLSAEGRELKAYRVALGRATGPKEREGDRRTPEGAYTIAGRKPDSAYHLALRVSYPDVGDVARAAAAGVPPGGDIMIHGVRNGLGWLGRLHRTFDWTAGCVAVTNAEIEEIWTAVPDGTPVEIRP